MADMADAGLDLGMVRDGMMTVEEAIAFTSYTNTALYFMMSAQQGLLKYHRHPDNKRRLIPCRELVTVLSDHLVSRTVLTHWERLELVSEGAMTLKEAVKQSGYSRSKLWEWMKAGTLVYLKPPRSDRRIPQVALLRLMASNMAIDSDTYHLSYKAAVALNELAAELGLTVPDAATLALKVYAARVVEAGESILPIPLPKDEFISKVILWYCERRQVKK